MIDLGKFPRDADGVVARLPSGWVLMGESQFLRGYCVLLADPAVSDLNAFDGEERAQFMADMALVGDAVQAVVGALRINYSVLGNLVPILHGHVIPRFADEPAERRGLAFWAFPEPLRNEPAFELERDALLMSQIFGQLGELGGEVSDLVYGWRKFA
jgi:diadenosine tetraphosphate (Ap4A) HIT family hydrolase